MLPGAVSGGHATGLENRSIVIIFYVVEDGSSLIETADWFFQEGTCQVLDKTIKVLDKIDGGVEECWEGRHRPKLMTKMQAVHSDGCKSQGSPDTKLYNAA